jgi:GNAT superfamily N-acetyltransferase
MAKFVASLSIRDNGILVCVMPLMSIIPVSAELPEGIALLRTEADREGHRHMARLVNEWDEGINRFDRIGECLLAIYDGKRLVGIGGLTQEPQIARVLRMRRVYVPPADRRKGIGRLLVAALVKRAVVSASVIAVHAGTDEAAVFWESMGFKSCSIGGATHRLELMALPTRPSLDDNQADCLIP